MALGKEGQQDYAQAPHWMRLLEEKYQRLHAKILNQASKFTHRRASNITTRLLKESRRKRATSVPGPNHTDLGNDQEENPSQIDGAEINEAIQPGCYNESPVQVECTQNCSRKQAKHSLGHRPFTQEGTRSRIFSDSTILGENSYSTTPQSSGVVTRISSAFPRTGLSSACDVSLLQTPRGDDVTLEENDDVLNSDGHAQRLNKALRLQLENQGEEWAIGIQRLPTEGDPNSSDEAEENEETKSEKMNIHCQTERTDTEAMARRRRRHITRPVKTSISRISHKTSKSCPAAFVVPQGDNNTVITNNMTLSSAVTPSSSKQLPHSVVPLTAKGVQEGRMRVFARMSLEARHAIDETLKEMKMEEDALKAMSNQNISSDHVNGNVPDNDNNVNEGDNDNDNDKVDNYKSDNASNSSIRNNVSAHTGNMNDNMNDTQTQEQQQQQQQQHRNNYQNVDDASSDVSLASGDINDYATQENRDYFPLKMIKGQMVRNGRLNSNSNGHQNGMLGMSSNRNLNTGLRLPQINQGSLFCQDEFPTPHPRLPSIRRANLAFRENTFEITPPDFDIRFRDIITCQKGDRDTPPLDVRQQSIEKCQQWLVQHTPRR